MMCHCTKNKGRTKYVYNALGQQYVRQMIISYSKTKYVNMFILKFLNILVKQGWTRSKQGWARSKYSSQIRLGTNISSCLVNDQFQPLKQIWEALSLKVRTGCLFRYRYFPFFNLPLVNDLNFINCVNSRNSVVNGHLFLQKLLFRFINGFCRSLTNSSVNFRQSYVRL